MTLNTDRLYALVGLILGVPGAVLLFLSEQVAIGVLVTTICVLLLIIWYWQKKPPFTILSIEKILTIHDEKGSNATLVRHQKTRANHKGLTEFWCRNISADGSISNILINGEKPHESKQEAGDTHACYRFKKPKKAEDIFNVDISYDLTNSFHATTETLIHTVSTETKNLKLIAEFPKQRTAKSARVDLRYGGETNKELPPPLISGNKIEAEIKRPLLGAEYCLEWDW